MKKHLSAIITSIGIMIGIILLILIQVIGKTNILDILVRCYAFSIPLWITIIVSLKRKEKLQFLKKALYFAPTLGQFTRNYTQTTKRGLLTTNKS